MEINLKQLLKYKNSKIISRYRNDYPNANMPAKQALTELLKYIWLCQKHTADKIRFPSNISLKFRCVIHAEMEDIDKMWHTFLLFTKDYQAFCHDYLNGVFFHHQPLTTQTRNKSKIRYEKELRRYLSYIHENLGEDTLVKWFKE